MSSFESRLDQILSHLDDPVPPLYAEMKERLEKVAARLQGVIDPSKSKATVTLEPGHALSIGQQFNVVVQIPKRNSFSDTIFRAYIPPSGSPVTLDFFGDMPRLAGRPEQLERQVIDFLSLPAVQGLMRGLRETVQSTP